MIIVVTGAKAVGKTTSLLQSIKTLTDNGFSVGGILSKGIWKDDKRYGYTLINITNNTEELLAAEDNLEGNIITHCSFTFRLDAISNGIEAIKEGAKRDILFIDEVGNMELSKKGWSEAFKYINPNKITILSVRADVVEKLSSIGINPDKIITVTSDISKVSDEIVNIIMKKAKEDTKEFWDTRAKSFPRHKEGDTYQNTILKTLENIGIDFKGKHVLDLGSGAGVYTLRIARNASKVTALDISYEMLEKIKADAVSNNINNIKTVEADWLDYEPTEKFDIIFASLTPAIGTLKAVEKVATHKGATVISISFVTPIKAYLLDELFKDQGYPRTQRSFENTLGIWLKKHNKPFKSIKVQGDWVTLRTKKEMYDNCLHVLEAHKYKVDMDKLEKFIERYKNNEGLYSSKTGYDVEIIVWDIE